MRKIIIWLKEKRLSIRCIEGELLLLIRYEGNLRIIVNVPSDLQDRYHLRDHDVENYGWGDKSFIADFIEEDYTYRGSAIAEICAFIAPPINYINFKSIHVLWRSNIILDTTEGAVNNEECIVKPKWPERYMGYMFVRVNWKELQKLKIEDETNIKRKIDKKAFFGDLMDEMLKDGQNICYYPDAMRAFYKKYGVNKTTKGCSESSLRDIMKMIGKEFYCEVPDKQRSTRSPQNLNKYIEHIEIKYI